MGPIRPKQQWTSGGLRRFLPSFLLSDRPARSAYDTLPDEDAITGKMGGEAPGERPDNISADANQSTDSGIDHIEITNFESNSDDRGPMRNRRTPVGWRDSTEEPMDSNRLRQFDIVASSLPATSTSFPDVACSIRLHDGNSSGDHPFYAYARNVFKKESAQSVSFSMKSSAIQSESAEGVELSEAHSLYSGTSKDPKRYRITWKTTVYATLITVSWFGSSLLLTFTNKYLFSVLKFNYPVFVTFIHFSIMSFCIYSVFLCYYGVDSFPTVSFSDYLKFLFPIAACAAGEIALTNKAYQLIPISAITVLKSSSAFYVYLFSVFLGLEKFRCSLFCAVVFTMASILYALPGMEVTSILGVVLVTLAVMCSGTRWVLVHSQLQSNRVPALHLMLFTKPIGSVFLALASLLVESNFFSNHIMADYPPGIEKSIIFALIGSVALAFLLTFSEYLFVGETSSVTLCVAGLGKEALTITMAMLTFGEAVSLKSIIGVALSLLGIALYTLLRVNSANEPMEYAKAGLDDATDN